MATHQRIGTQRNPSAEDARMRERRQAADTNLPDDLPPYENSSKQSSTSKRPSVAPRSVHELAAQVNALATRVLSGALSEEEIELARLYSGLVRTTASLINSDIAAARLTHTEPNLSLEEES